MSVSTTPMATISEKNTFGRSKSTVISLNSAGRKLFPSRKVVVKYNGISIAIREATISDTQVRSVSKDGGLISAALVHDNENWEGKHILQQDGEFYIIEKN